jgi:drug/metabolite transporter (DMT)-like permease
VAPALFVVLWSTGFIVARYGTKDAGPLTFLAIRTAIAAVILFGVARLMGEAKLSRDQIRIQWIVGAGIHAMYLGGVFVAIDHGLPSGVSALIAALHPVLTTVLGRVVLGENLNVRREVGVALGCIGVIAVVLERGGASDGVSTLALVAMGIAVIGMSGGTLIQRRTAVGVPLLGGTAWQYAVTTVILGIGAVVFEGWEFTVTARSLWSLAWAVGVLSLAAILIMLWLLHRQAASQVSSLFFLTPALSTVEGAILFGEELGVLSVVGLVVAIAGVWLATSTRSTSLQT